MGANSFNTVRNGNRLQIITVREYTFANDLHSIFNDYCFQSLTASESVISNRLHITWYCN